MENILGVPADGEEVSVCDRLVAVSAETAVVRNDLAEQRELVLNRVEELAAAMDAQNQAAIETQRELEAEIALLKRAMRGLPREGEVATKVKVPEPKPFNGARNAKDLENFLWDMEQYFKAAGCLAKRWLQLLACIFQGMPNYGGEPVWKMMQMLVEGKLNRGKP